MNKIIVIIVVCEGLNNFVFFDIPSQTDCSLYEIQIGLADFSSLLFMYFIAYKSSVKSS